MLGKVASHADLKSETASPKSFGAQLLAPPDAQSEKNSSAPDEGSASTTPRASMAVTSLDVDQHSNASKMSSEDSDLGFSTATTPGPDASGPAEAPKRRPSLPSFLGKAAHPAATLRAALTSNSNSSTAGAVDIGDDLTSSDPLRALASRRPSFSSRSHSTSVCSGPASSSMGKRSLSNFFRKVTAPTGQPQTEPASPTSTPASLRGRGLSFDDQSHAVAGLSGFVSSASTPPMPHVASSSRQSLGLLREGEINESAINAQPASSPGSDPHARRRAQSLASTLQRKRLLGTAPPKEDPLISSFALNTPTLMRNGRKYTGESSQESSSDDPQEYIGDSPTRLESPLTAPHFTAPQWRNTRSPLVRTGQTLRNAGDTPTQEEPEVGRRSPSASLSALPQNETPISRSRQRSKGSLSSIASAPASSAICAAPQATASTAAQDPSNTPLNMPVHPVSTPLPGQAWTIEQRTRSDSLASTTSHPRPRIAGTDTSSSSSLRSAYTSSEQAVSTLLRHAAQFASGQPVQAEDGLVTTLAAQLAAYGDALERESQRSRAASTTSSSGTGVSAFAGSMATSMSRGLSYRPSREQLNALPSVRENQPEAAQSPRQGLKAPTHFNSDSVSPKSKTFDLVSEKVDPHEAYRNDPSFDRNFRQQPQKADPMVRARASSDETRRREVGTRFGRQSLDRTRPIVGLDAASSSPADPGRVKKQSSGPRRPASSDGPARQKHSLPLMNYRARLDRFGGPVALKDVTSDAAHAKHQTSINAERTAQTAQTDRVRTLDVQSDTRSRSSSNQTGGSVSTTDQRSSPASSSLGGGAFTPLTVPSPSSKSKSLLEAQSRDEPDRRLQMTVAPQDGEMHANDSNPNLKDSRVVDEAEEKTHRHRSSTPTELPSWAGRSDLAFDDDDAEIAQPAPSTRNLETSSVTVQRKTPQQGSVYGDRSQVPGPGPRVTSPHSLRSPFAGSVNEVSRQNSVSSAAGESSVAAAKRSGSLPLLLSPDHSSLDGWGPGASEAATSGGLFAVPHQARSPPPLSSAAGGRRQPLVLDSHPSMQPESFAAVTPERGPLSEYKALPRSPMRTEATARPELSGRAQSPSYARKLPTSHLPSPASPDKRSQRGKGRVLPTSSSTNKDLPSSPIPSAALRNKDPEAPPSPSKVRPSVDAPRHIGPRSGSLRPIRSQSSIDRLQDDDASMYHRAGAGSPTAGTAAGRTWRVKNLLLGKR